MKIINLNAIQILDSRANPTLQVDVILEDGSKGSFQVPSGASTGIHEAHELRDENMNFYHGKSVMRAVENVLNLREKLLNQDFTQESLDSFLIATDGSQNKEILGANAILGISVAFAKACAMHFSLPIYEYLRRVAFKINMENKKVRNLEDIHLFANIINGGLHSGNKLNIQEFMIVPTNGSPIEKIRAISEIYHELKSIIEEKYGKNDTAVGDEGGFAPSISKAEEALNLIVEAVKKANYEGLVTIALDSAASDFYDADLKLYEVEPGLKLDYKKLSAYYSDLVAKYPIVSIEDPFAEDDFEGFAYFMNNLPTTIVQNPFNKDSKIIVVGDDLLVTNPSRISMAMEKNLCSSLLLKINQIGTLTESLKAFSMANGAGWHTIVSHRSGETSDDFISDLAVGLSSSIKIGAPARGERVAKYNKLLNIYSKK